MIATVTLPLADYEKLVVERNGFENLLREVRGQLICEFHRSCPWIDEPLFKPLADAAREGVVKALDGGSYSTTGAWLLSDSVRNLLERIKKNLIGRDDNIMHPQALFLAMDVDQICKAFDLIADDIAEPVKTEAAKLRELPWLKDGFLKLEILGI